MAEDGGVIIELKENKSANGGDHTYQASTIGGNNVKITVRKSEEPSGSDFYRYTHTLQNGGGQFILKEVKDDKNSPIVIPKESDKKVTSVSAYYWKHDNGTNPPTKVLLVEVAYSGSDGTKYYKNSEGTQWIETSLDGEDIEKKLDELNCYNNGAVTLDLTKDAYGPNGNLPCCEHHKGSSKVKITPVQVNNHHDHQHVGSDNLTVTKYSITNGKLAAIKLGDSGKKSKRKSIILDGSKFPMDSVESVYALYSNGGTDPILIYVDKNPDTQNSGWYKNDDSNDTWTKADELSDVTPNNFGKLECKQWNRLVKGLHTNSGLQECQEHLKKQEKPQEESDSTNTSHQTQTGNDPSSGDPQQHVASTDNPSNLVVSTQGAIVNEAGGPEEKTATVPDQPAEGGQAAKNDQSADSTPAETTTSTESATEAFTGVGEAGIIGLSSWAIFGSTSATLTGAGGLTGLGWWMFKRSKGDPWVRHRYPRVFKECTILRIDLPQRISPY
ncbi:hypothetical protein BEWA_039030 [Theileria equi strain WA]|uniref:Uncharacterized protein n=1 Tax=Theileria equi strain WA TaxID=1537102 RepID=L1LF48_THEEQ|nr:hypothetical protein BEWA_039030 [Theileria equi strain WA]EKX73865.1 hypothetical protein BEWA_039030 [Theileria equi strain WA]|eukprot:XP_004833317.1 hypothetical protein BEWA_039030 [Theileria equi strain WA]